MSPARVAKSKENASFDSESQSPLRVLPMSKDLGK